ncbi:glycosyl transferase family 2 [Limimaricola soesokkakensis]|uniref:Glycosyl transferase family 2 n=1 Tax=Limimaricola soesokkakensis TaxID=1343159 RepID=A0A1X6Z853_9RHOB|nr:glycosyltransferase [Limimaricola soesokkakensis]PSK86589.1 glycosyl transferase family 2 [Limimaricola soesokkakensis]SLN43745.1 Glycosyl transferase family 2 [Limimaricola soesokkakensis]
MTAPMPMDILIPASNEAGLIEGCLSALAASEPLPGPVCVTVIANGCRDATADAARAAGAALTARDWTLRVIELAQGSKVAALNAGEAALTRPAIRVYLDADVTVSPSLLLQLHRALDRPEPLYASGLPRITGQGRVARAYARLWARLPFMTHGAPGCGLFAVNPAGRARWDMFPDLISDDGFVRLCFSPDERIAVPARYDWPVAEGFAALLRVRRRQDAGMAQIASCHPDMLAREGKPALGPLGVARLALRDPAGFAVYGAVALGVRLRPAPSDWSRGR